MEVLPFRGSVIPSDHFIKYCVWLERDTVIIREVMKVLT